MKMLIVMWYLEGVTHWKHGLNLVVFCSEDKVSGQTSGNSQIS